MKGRRANLTMKNQYVYSIRQLSMKCGLEIHTQLKTKYKLFSLSRNESGSRPNSRVSYFDCGLPGTQPTLNPEALYLALKAATIFDCDLQDFSQFDRKHYFYPDQPIGYQITQHYRPIARNGYLKLTKAIDGIKSNEKIIRFEQIQIEQDTGKLNNEKLENSINVDYNRANVPLIELVTKPDFESIDEVKIFLKKYQQIVTYYGICTGELETGAMRVDVNISLNGGNRVEIKNLGSTGEIVAAMKCEINRQKLLLAEGMTVKQETRGWDGSTTNKLRDKENAVDYRYFPDPELPFIRLNSKMKADILAALPPLPDVVIKKLSSKPYNLKTKHAKFFVENKALMEFYLKLFQIIVIEGNGEPGKVNNWMVNNVLNILNSSSLSLVDLKLSPEKLAELIKTKESGLISNTAAKQILKQILIEPKDRELSISELIEKYDLESVDNVSHEELDEALEEICVEIIQNNADIVDKIVKGKKNSIKYLLGLAMKETQGRVKPNLIEDKLMTLIHYK